MKKKYRQKFKEICHQQIPKRNVKSSSERRKITGQKLNIHKERNGVGEGKNESKIKFLYVVFLSYLVDNFVQNSKKTIY